MIQARICLVFSFFKTSYPSKTFCQTKGVFPPEPGVLHPIFDQVGAEIEQNPKLQSNRILVHLGVLASWREFALPSRTTHLNRDSGHCRTFLQTEVCAPGTFTKSVFQKWFRLRDAVKNLQARGPRYVARASSPAGSGGVSPLESCAFYSAAGQTKSSKCQFWQSRNFCGPPFFVTTKQCRGGCRVTCPRR